MRSSRIRSLLLTAVLLAFCGLGWFYLAPTQIGGSTHYVITHGISMEPMLHTGDLVLVRPVSDYKVGQVVAYHSTLLHTVVLHRIIRISGGHYTFKGDNNSFIDPTHPTRALIVGAMWLHITHGGTVLQWIHKPWVAAILTGGVALLLLYGGDQERRRRRRRRRGHQPATRSTTPTRGPGPVTNRRLLAGCVVVAILFAGLGVYAFIKPKMSSTTTAVPYTQQVSFGYSAHVRPGAAYPTGVVSTGDPLYSQIVHRLAVTAAYHLSSTTSYSLAGTVRLRGTLANTTGWSRRIWLGPAAPITAGRAIATADISLPQLNALINRVSTQVGLAAGSYTLAIVPQLSLKGEVGGQPLPAATQPSLSLDLGAAQLLSEGSSSTLAGGVSSSTLVHTTTGNVTTAHATIDKLGPIPMSTVRLIGITGFALFTLLALLLSFRSRDAEPDPVERINSRYKHLIVPVSAIATDPEHPPIEVRTIEALAQLAERSERLILHDHQDDVDNYLIDDQGTIFRFQALRLGHTNGNGNGHRNGSGNGHGNGSRSDEPAKVTAGVAAGAAATVAADDVEEASGPPSDAASAPASSRRNDEREASPPPPSRPAAATTATREYAPSPETYLNGFGPLTDPDEDAQAIHLSGKVMPDVTIFTAEPRLPPRPGPAHTHWSQRPEVRVGFTLGPLLTLLAWRRWRGKRVEPRRLDTRPVEVDEPSFPQSYDRRGARNPPQRGPGDRRRSDRRRN